MHGQITRLEAQECHALYRRVSWIYTQLNIFALMNKMFGACPCLFSPLMHLLGAAIKDARHFVVPLNLDGRLRSRYKNGLQPTATNHR